MRGLEGWLFIRGEFEPACRFNTEAVAGSLARAAEAFARARQSFRFLLVPDKHTVYPDRVPHQLPFGPPCGDGGRLTTSAVRAAGAAGIDAAPLLVAARGEADPPRLYYATDSHWTPSGAIVAIGALVGSIDPEVWATAAVRRDGEVRRRTDLPTLLGLRRVEETPRLRVREGVRIETIDVEVPAQIHNARGVFRVVARGDAPLIEGRTIIVYDSFFGISVPLVAPFFADSTWVHVGDLMNQPELGRFLGGFDTVILERVERGVYETDFGAVLGALVRGGS